jgi:hypothetical protein
MADIPFPLSIVIGGALAVVSLCALVIWVFYTNRRGRR